MTAAAPMRRRRRTLMPCCCLTWASLIWASLSAPAAAGDVLAAQGPPVSATISHAVPSPDGDHIAFVAAHPGARARLFVATAESGSSRPFTSGEVPVSAPGWSPDGRWVAYLHHPTPGSGELAMMPSDGGGARRLTSPGMAVEAFQWSPTGQAIALLARTPESRDPAERDTAAAPGTVVETTPAPRHLWLLPVDRRGNAGPPRRLTPGDLHVGSALPSGAGTFDWSPDGREIAFTHTRTAAVDDWKTADISILELSTGRVRPFQQSNAAEFSPSYSPDGRRIAFNISVFPPSAIGQWRVGTARVDGSGLKLLSATPDEQPAMVGWISNRQLLVRERHGMVTALWKLPADGGAPRRFDDGQSVLSAVTLSASATRLAFVTTNESTPPEAAVTPLRRFRPVTVSAANAHLTRMPRPETKPLSWSSADGLSVEGLLTLPAPVAGSAVPPLVLMLPDEPAAAFSREHPARSGAVVSPALLASRGYAVLRANVRGAGGYGYAYRAASRGDWGGGDVDDLLAGLDLVIEAGLADPGRLAIVGWGHGGYLAAAAITRSHRFGAAIVGAPMTDLVQMRATAEGSGFLVDYLAGEYPRREDVYRRLSPLLKAHRITTPVLILHGEADQRVPAAQGLALHRTLQREGIDTRMILYPGARHRLVDPAQRQHAAGEMLRWLERHLSD